MKYLFGYSDFAYTFDFDNDLSEGTLSQSSPAVLEDVYTITNVAAQGRVTRPASYGFLDASLPFLGGASVLLAAGIGPAIGLDQVPVSWRWMDHDEHVIGDMAMPHRKSVELRLLLPMLQSAQSVCRLSSIVSPPNENGVM